MASVRKEGRRLKKTVQVEEGAFQSQMDQVVRGTVEETPNGLIQAEADRLCHGHRCEIVHGTMLRVRSLHAILRNTAQTPARTRPAPINDPTENDSPPAAHPMTIAPGGMMSEMVCRFVAAMRARSQ